MKYSITIAGMPDREKLAAEIWNENNRMIAEINQENEYLELEIYFSKKDVLKLDYEEFLSALQEGKKKLLG
ncbi:MAG TPA: hypothetical protein DCS93_35380 [Microscillaceae bacterium]|nr:hypothetical protein [Microscillaceae bacterium]